MARDKEKEKEYNKKYYSKNKEKMSKYRKKHYKENATKEKNYKRIYRTIKPNKTGIKTSMIDSSTKIAIIMLFELKGIERKLQKTEWKCPSCGSIERRKTSGCKACQKSRADKYYSENRDKVCEQTRARYHAKKQLKEATKCSQPQNP